MLRKFELLETQSQTLESFICWAQATPHFSLIHQKHFAQVEFSTWARGLVDDLVRVGAAARDGDCIRNAG